MRDVATRTPHQVAARRASDRSIRPLRPGNAGGGKGPDFRDALEEGEDKGDW